MMLARTATSSGRGRLVAVGLVLLFGMLVCRPAPAAPPTLVQNGGFEEGVDAASLTGWAWSVANGCEGALAVDRAVKSEGAQCVRLSSQSPQEPHVYCGLRQTVGPLYRGLTYRIRLRVKGSNVGACWFGGGPEWRLRKGLPRGTFDWQDVSVEYAPPSDMDSFLLIINVDSVTEALWVDNVRMEADVDTSAPITRGVTPADAMAVPVPKNPALQCDGDLSEWRGETFHLADAGGRIDAQFRLAWNEKAFWIAVQTKDDEPARGGDPSAMWQHDSIQIAADPRNEDTVGSYGPNDLELGFGLTKQGPAAYAWHLPGHVGLADLAAAQHAIVHRDGVTTYEIALPYSLLAPVTASAATGFGLNLVVNDRDAAAPRVGAEWTPGIYLSKSPDAFKTVVLTDGPWLQACIRPRVVASGGTARFTGSMFLDRPVEGTLRIGRFYEGPVALPAGLSETIFPIQGDMLDPEDNEIVFRLLGPELDIADSCTIALSMADKKALALIAEQEQRLPALENWMQVARDDGIPVHYPQADITIARIFCGYCRDDVAHGRFERAHQVAQEVAALLDRAERELREGVEVPVVHVDTLEIRDGSLWGRCTVGEREEERPVFLTGYGHFSPVVDAMPILSTIGIHVVQFEMGPNSVVFENEIRTDRIRDWVLASLDRARDNNIAVCLLVSPHYFPQWALERWPETLAQSGFMKQSLDAPQVREIYNVFLRTLIPAIKDHPALQSICLSNEPISLASAGDPFRLPLWHDYLKRAYPTIDSLNERYGTDYVIYAQAPHPAMNLDAPAPAVYDAIRFNQDQHACWHRWMADIIHEMAPDLPCHAKVMALPAHAGTVLWGTDPWDFAELSQMNGNDCYFMPNASVGPWESQWIVQNMYYDLQRSMKRVPVFNTENHIIRDREQAYVAPEHIYAAIWQGAIHGQGASTTWAWQRTYDATSDFEGLILHRAGCTAAMSRCALDLMRLSREVAGLQNLRPRVALLYSHAATLWAPDYVKTRTDAYEALNFCGLPIGFITDDQIAAGWLDTAHGSGYDCLIVPGATAAAPAAIDAIRAFAAGGGAVVAYGHDNLTRDAYGR
ncbi:MAG: beta-galactosidase, partial [Candidatus Hydrogenedentes bacterium]|nr:beta-galactosidase [Candidatus Hydrogenedentota bacterium]